MKMKLALVDDHQLFRKGILALLQNLDFIDVIHEYASGEDLLKSIAGSGINCVLMDMSMPGKDGLQTMQELHKAAPHISVIFLTVHNEEKFILNCMEEGASGFLEKDAHPNEMIKAVKSVFETGYYFNAHVARIMHLGLADWKMGLRQTPLQLNERETDVLRLICQEHTTTEIGDKLALSPRTIEGYRERLMEKTQARNTVGLVVYAAQAGWLKNWI